MNCADAFPINMRIMVRHREWRKSEIHLNKTNSSFYAKGTIPACDMDKVTCVANYKSFYNGALPGVNSTSATLADSPCKCLPDCELYQYPSEISSGRLNRSFSFNSISFLWVLAVRSVELNLIKVSVSFSSKDVKIEDQSLIHVYFIDLVSTRYRKGILP